MTLPKTEIDRSDGQYSIDYNSTDNAGNVETLQTQEITVDNTPPTTTPDIGGPKYVDPAGNTYVSSTTPFALVAQDNLGGTGVAFTSYRIHKGTYNTGWQEYSVPFKLTGLSEGTYSIDYNSTDMMGNIEPTNTMMVILDGAPATKIAIDSPKYVSCWTYVTKDTPFTLTATDKAGVKSTAYRITNSKGYDSGWRNYIGPFKLTSLLDGCYTIAYNSTDNVNNVETPHQIIVALFSWNYVFKDTYGRGTILKINTNYKFFQFITPSKDYGIKKATYMQVCGCTITIKHQDSTLKLISTTINTKTDYCVANAWDIKTGKHYILVDKPGFE